MKTILVNSVEADGRHAAACPNSEALRTHPLRGNVADLLGAAAMDRPEHWTAAMTKKQMRAEIERLENEVQWLYPSLASLVYAYRNKHSPQHRRSVLNEAATILDVVHEARAALEDSQ